MTPFPRKVILVVTSILFTFGILEVALRAYGVQTSTRAAYEYDAVLGWRPKKNFRGFRSTLNYGHFTYYDAEGLPTDRAHYGRALDATTPSIAFVGDSFVESYYVPYERSFPHLVGTKFPGYQVINLGVSGYSPDQYMLYARRMLGTYNAKAIAVIFFPFNDVSGVLTSEVQGYPKPYFPEGEFSEPANIPLENVSPAGEPNILKRILNSSAVYAAIRPVVRKRIPVGIASDIRKPKLYTESDMLRSLAFVEQIQKEHQGAHLFVYYIPQREEVQAKDVYGRNVVTYRTACTALSLECYLMSDALQDGEDVVPLYIPVDGHLSELGSAKAANHLSEILTPILKRTPERQ